LEEWQRGLENAQELPDPLDPNRKGYFFSDPLDMKRIGTMVPTVFPMNNRLLHTSN